MGIILGIGTGNRDLGGMDVFRLHTRRIIKNYDFKMDGANRDRGIVWLGPLADFDFLEPAGGTWIRISICELVDLGNRKRDLDGLFQKLAGAGDISRFVGSGSVFVQVGENFFDFILGRQTV